MAVEGWAQVWLQGQHQARLCGAGTVSCLVEVVVSQIYVWPRDTATHTL